MMSRGDKLIIFCTFVHQALPGPVCMASWACLQACEDEDSVWLMYETGQRNGGHVQCGRGGFILGAIHCPDASPIQSREKHDAVAISELIIFDSDKHHAQLLP